MAVEDHPDYENWSRALDELVMANSEYRVAVEGNQSSALIEGLRHQLNMALAKFNLISAKIDA